MLRKVSEVTSVAPDVGRCVEKRCESQIVVRVYTPSTQVVTT